MPITRRRRANPPEQPESNNHLAEQTENAAEIFAAEQQSPMAPEPASEGPAQAASEPEHEQSMPSASDVSYPPMMPPATNGDRSNGERQDAATHQPHSIESGRRTARGELFRRPPVPPAVQPPVAMPAAAQLQPPSHEITLPLGKKPGDIHGDALHLAYNPGYTGADEMRALLLHKLVQESKAGGRARCWSCGAVAVVYDRWNTRSKTFGEIGVAICEICGVWSVM